MVFFHIDTASLELVYCSKGNVRSTMLTLCSMAEQEQSPDMPRCRHSSPANSSPDASSIPGTQNESLTRNRLLWRCIRAFSQSILPPCALRSFPPGYDFFAYLRWTDSIRPQSYRGLAHQVGFTRCSVRMLNTAAASSHGDSVGRHAVVDSLPF